MESLQPLAAAAPAAGPRPALPREIPLSAEEVRALRRFHLGAAAGGDSAGEGGVRAGRKDARAGARKKAGERAIEPGMIPAALWPYRDAAPTALEAELAALAEAIPEVGRWAGVGAATPLRLARLAALERLLPAWEAFRAEAQSLAERLAVVLAGDQAPGAGMGELGGRFIDPGALAGVLAHRRGGDLEPERRRRLERARTALAGFAAGAPPEPVLVTPPGGGPEAPEAPEMDGPDAVAVRGALTGASAAPALESNPAPGVAAPFGVAVGAPGAPAALEDWSRAEAEDVCAAAGERFDREAAALAEVLRAARLARLELAGDYDPALHGPWLERFDWQAFSRDELMLLPPVVALLPADLAAGAGMVALSRLLLSGRPVQVVVPVVPAHNPGAPADSADGDPAARLAGYRFEPAYLGIAHREALVQQTAAARPAHAFEGFRRAARAACAALHVVAVPAAEPAAGEPGPHLLAAAALEGRAHPLFHYDPEAGRSWARRFDFAGNPAPAADWPRYELAAAAEEGGETALEIAFTFADYALLDPRFAPCFRALPAGAAAEELTPLADWLGLDTEEAPAHIPFLWAVDSDGRLRRLAVSRALALACRDRLDFWRTLQELSGARSGYARTAAESAREEEAVRARAERERLEARHAEELAWAQREAAERLATRLTEMLLAPEPGTAAETAGGPVGAALPAFAGGDVEQVTATLLALVGPAIEADGDGAAAPADPRVERTAQQLLAALGNPAALAEPSPAGTGRARPEPPDAASAAAAPAVATAEATAPQ